MFGDLVLLPWENVAQLCVMLSIQETKCISREQLKLFFLHILPYIGWQPIRNMDLCSNWICAQSI